MADYNVTARFEADAAGYISAVREAQRATEDLGTTADKASKTTGKAFDGADKSIAKTGKSAETASKQTSSLGDSAATAGSEAQSAFDGAKSGIEATASSAEAAGASMDGLGGAATAAGSDTQGAFDGATAGLDGTASAADQTSSSLDGVGNAASAAGSETQGAFSGAATGLDATATAAAGASTALVDVGDAAGHSGRHAASAFDGIANATNVAGIEIQGLAGSYTDLGNRASVAMQRATQAVRNHQADIKQIGGTLAVVGGGWAALNTTMAATGIAYNTLQQVSAKSMQTMMGSIEGANAQMERFHAFADESPFSRATFLQAQQQLMAFGMEAERVVPSLEGIQNAVAAIGGGNAEIMQLTDILGAIQGQGKITGRELQRMGQMGIDAADIIGEQMGKSGNAIREEITAGTLDAATAIEALTTGMTQRFDGAAAGLKETFEGAVDRVKAAFRDLSGDMFDWAVGSEGGGFLVDVLNGVADLIRELEKLPAPVKNAMGIVSTLGSTAAVAAGGFLLLAPQVVDAWDAFTRLSKATGATRVLEGIQSKAPGAGRALRTVGRYALYAAAGFAALQAISAVIPSGLDQIADSADIADVLQNMGNNADYARDRVNDMLSVYVSNRWSGTAMGDFMDNFTGQVESLGNAMSNLDAGAFSQTVQALMGLVGFETDIKVSTQALETFDGALASMAKSGDWDGVSAGMQLFKAEAEDAGFVFEDMARQHLPEVMAALQSVADQLGVGDHFESAAGKAELLEWALTGVPPAAIEAAGGLEGLEDSASGLDATLEGVINKLQTMGLVQRNVYESAGDHAAAIDEFNEALAENGATMDKNTEAGRANREALVKMIDAGQQHAQNLLESGAAADEAAGAMRTTYDAIVSNAEAMGMSEGKAEALARELMGIPENVDIDTHFDEFATEAAIALANEIEAIPEHKIIGIAAQEDGSFVSVQQSIDELGNEHTVIVNADGDVIEVTEQIKEINGHEMTVYVDDNGTIYEVEQQLEEIEKKRPQSTIEVDADTTNADLEMGNLEDGRYSSTIEVDANTEGAQAEIDSIDSTEPATVDTTADTSGAEIVLNEFGLIDWPATVAARAETSSATESISSVTTRPWLTTITGLGNMSAAEDAANTTARGRNTTFTGIPQVGTAEGTLNTTARQRNPLFLGVPNTATAEGNLNTTGRQRRPIFLGVPNTISAEGALNTTARDRNAKVNATKGSDGVSGWLSGLTKARSVVVDVVRRVVGNTGGIANSMGAAGHFSQELPRLATGGRLPYTGLGTDMILARNRHGVPTAWVDDGEWIIREQMSRKYHNALGLINMDHPAVHHLAAFQDGGVAGRTRLGAAAGAAGVTSAQLERLLSDLQEQRNVTYEAHLHTADATMHDAMNAFERMDMAESRR